MEVNREFLQNYVKMLDSLLVMTRDKLVWQNLAIPLLGQGWQQKFEQARSDNRFLGEWELYLAEVQTMRAVAVAMLDQLQRGEPVRPPTNLAN
jgi:hypothetical protein